MHARKPRTPVVLAINQLVIFIGLLLAPAAVSADVGAGVGASPITLAEPAHPGHTYVLPPLYVVNTGTDPASYSVFVERLTPGDDQPVPGSWIKLDQNSIVLQPQQAANLSVRLDLPPQAAPGSYLTNLVVVGSSPENGRGSATVEAGAAAKVMFTVAPVSASDIAVPDSIGFWLLIGAVVLVVALGSVSGVHFARRRRASTGVRGL